MNNFSFNLTFEDIFGSNIKKKNDNKKNDNKKSILNNNNPPISNEMDNIDKYILSIEDVIRLSGNPYTPEPDSGYVKKGYEKKKPPEELNIDLIRQNSQLPLKDYFNKNLTEKYKAIVDFDKHWLNTYVKSHGYNFDGILRFTYKDSHYKIAKILFYFDNIQKISTTVDGLKNISNTFCALMYANEISFYRNNDPSIEKSLNIIEFINTYIIDKRKLTDYYDDIFIKHIRFLFTELKKRFKNIPDIYTDNNIPKTIIQEPEQEPEQEPVKVKAELKPNKITLYFIPYDINNKSTHISNEEYYQRKENIDKLFYIIDSIDSTKKDCTHVLHTDTENNISVIKKNQELYSFKAETNKIIYDGYTFMGNIYKNRINNNDYKEIIDFLNDNKVDICKNKTVTFNIGYDSTTYKTEIESHYIIGTVIASGKKINDSSKILGIFHIISIDWKKVDKITNKKLLYNLIYLYYLNTFNEIYTNISITTTIDKNIKNKCCFHVIPSSHEEYELLALVQAFTKSYIMKHEFSEDAAYLQFNFQMSEEKFNTYKKATDEYINIFKQENDTHTPQIRYLFKYTDTTLDKLQSQTILGIKGNMILQLQEISKPPIDDINISIDKKKETTTLEINGPQYDIKDIINKINKIIDEKNKQAKKKNINHIKYNDNLLTSKRTESEETEYLKSNKEQKEKKEQKIQEYEAEYQKKLEELQKQDKYIKSDELIKANLIKELKLKIDKQLAELEYDTGIEVLNLETKRKYTEINKQSERREANKKDRIKIGQENRAKLLTLKQIKDEKLKEI